MIPIGERDFVRLTTYLKDHYGINLTQKRTLVEGRLSNILRQRGYTSYDAYIDMVLSDRSGQEMSALLDKLTTNYSFFMREREHFTFFEEVMLPEIQQTSKDYDMRIWSAGCSTGEEAYSLAMIIQDFLGTEKVRWDATVLATDISVKVLTTAVQGIYDEEEMENVPKSWKRRYFETLPDGKYEVTPALKKEVIFRWFNLMEKVFPFRKPFHVIFCRNVMIYFDKKTKTDLINRLSASLEIGGYLVLGQAEGIDRDLNLGLESCIPSVYRKVR